MSRWKKLGGGGGEGGILNMDLSGPYFWTQDWTRALTYTNGVTTVMMSTTWP